jgi:hypothetical protein
VIDLGCGPGLPIAEVLVAEGLNVFGLEIADILVPGGRLLFTSRLSRWCGTMR